MQLHVHSAREGGMCSSISDFSEVYDFSDGFTTQSQSDYNVILGHISLCFVCMCEVLPTYLYL